MVEVKLVDIKPQQAAAVKYKTPVEKIPENMGKAFGRLMAYLQARNITSSGAPFSFYPAVEPDENGEWEVVTGMPVDSEITAEGDVVPFDLPAGNVAVATHLGPYETLETTYKDMSEWMKEHRLAPADMMWEYYFTDPKLEPDQSKWRTDVYWPVIDR